MAEESTASSTRVLNLTRKEQFNILASFEETDDPFTPDD